MKECFIFTVVIEIDETLIHYNGETSILQYRPYLDTFLKKLQALKMEILVFSRQNKNYTDTLVS